MPLEWNEQQVQFLHDNVGKGQLRDLAEALGVSRNAIAGKVFREGLAEKRNFKSENRGKKTAKGAVAAAQAETPTPEMSEFGPPLAPVVIQRRHARCRFPLWGDERPGPNAKFCSELVKPGKTYCQEHESLCYVHGSRPGRSGAGLANVARS
jgi:hypothetical protein